MPPASYNQVLKVDADKCKKCSNCMICPGIEANPDGTPKWNNICTGCVSQKPACAQMCPVNAISWGPREAAGKASTVTLPEAPEVTAPARDTFTRPERLALSIRGVGGQGNLFFGKVLARMAFLAGYDATNVLKGETHGMAQMGGPVVSTFGCGNVACPDLAPASADCLIAMEESEVTDWAETLLVLEEGASDTGFLLSGFTLNFKDDEELNIYIEATLTTPEYALTMECDYYLDYTGDYLWAVEMLVGNEELGDLMEMKIEATKADEEAEIPDLSALTAEML
jgi:Pyruvate/2-oxoacid:ferredoxin oxidoreductase delta subunit